MLLPRPGPRAPSPRSCATPSGAAETSFDPTQLTDIYSRVITAHVFETLYAYDHLARPIQIRPLIAQALPEISPDFKTSPSACGRHLPSPRTRPFEASRAS